MSNVYIFPCVLTCIPEFYAILWITTDKKGTCIAFFVCFCFIRRSISLLVCRSIQFDLTRIPHATKVVVYPFWSRTRNPTPWSVGPSDSTPNIFELRMDFASLLLPNRPRMDCRVSGLFSVRELCENGKKSFKRYSLQFQFLSSLEWWKNLISFTHKRKEKKRFFFLLLLPS